MDHDANEQLFHVARHAGPTIPMEGAKTMPRKEVESTVGRLGIECIHFIRRRRGARAPGPKRKAQPRLHTGAGA